MKKDLVRVSVLNLNVVPFEKDTLTESEKVLAAHRLAKLGVIVKGEYENVKGTSKSIKKVIKAIANIRDLDNNWENTLFSFDEVIENEDLTRLKTLLHYMTTYGAEYFGVDIETYFPNEMSNEDKSKYSKIKEMLDEVEFKENIINVTFKHIDDVKKDLARFYEKYARPLSDLDIEIILEENIPVEIDKIVFKENQIKLLEKGVKTSNPELAIRYIKYKLGLNPNMLYTKDLKKMMSINVDDNIKKDCIKLIDNVIENDVDNSFLELLKQKRRMIKKLLAVIDYNKSEKYNEIKPFLRENKRIQRVKTKYSKVLFKHTNNSKLHLDVMRDKFIEYFKVYDDNKILENFEKMSIKNQIQIVNYIRKVLSKHNLIKTGRELKETYVLPHSSYTKEEVNDVVTEPEFRRLLKLDSNFNEYVKDNVKKLFENKNIKIDSKLLEYILENDIKYPISLRLEENSTFYYESGSSIKFESSKTLRCGIYWENSNESVDLDLSAIIKTNDNNIVKIGWNSDYTYDESIVFSGDVTDAPNGAAEFIDIINHKNIKFIGLKVNKYSGEPNNFHIGIMTNIEQFKKDDVNDDSRKKYFNPEKLKVGYSNNFGKDDKELFVGLVDLQRGLLYPCNIKGNNIVSDEMNEDAILLNTNKLSLNEVLDKKYIYDELEESEENLKNVKVIKDLNELVNFFLTNLY